MNARCNDREDATGMHGDLSRAREVGPGEKRFALCPGYLLKNGNKFTFFNVFILKPGYIGQGFFKKKGLFAIFLAITMKLKRNLAHGQISSSVLTFLSENCISFGHLTLT